MIASPIAKCHRSATNRVRLTVNHPGDAHVPGTGEADTKLGMLAMWGDEAGVLAFRNSDDTSNAPVSSRLLAVLGRVEGSSPAPYDLSGPLG